MPPDALARCLVDGTTPGEWYALLNGMVFFWIDPDRLARQARACKSSPQYVIEIDAARLLAGHGQRAFVTPINTGNAMRRAARRGRASFVPFSSWTESGWLHESERLRLPLRRTPLRPVELAIAGEVPDVADHILRIRRFG